MTCTVKKKTMSEVLKGNNPCSKTFPVAFLIEGRGSSVLHVPGRDASTTAGGDTAAPQAATRYTSLRVDSRTTNSGATLRWLGVGSRFSRTALIPSSTTPTADAPMVSMGWRTVVSDGV